jgi:D-aminopeptidase
VRAIPPMPGGDLFERLPGRWLHLDSGATVDVTIDAPNTITASTNGVAFTTIPTEDGRLATSRGSGDFTMRLTSDDTLEVERDAGVREALQRVVAEAVLPADLSGTYGSAEIAATWTIAGGSLRVEGPLRAAGPWDIEPVEGDCIRIYTPMILDRGWLDCRILRDAGDRVTGLLVGSGRVRGVVFSRLA